MRDELLAKFEQVESKHWWWEGRRRLIADFIDGFPGKRRLKLLDVGCGTGETMLFIKKRRPKYEIWGIDNTYEFAMAKMNALIKSITNSLIRFANPIIYSTFVFLYKS